MTPQRVVGAAFDPYPGGQMKTVLLVGIALGGLCLLPTAPPASAQGGEVWASRWHGTADRPTRCAESLFATRSDARDHTRNFLRDLRVESEDTGRRVVGGARMGRHCPSYAVAGSCTYGRFGSVRTYTRAGAVAIRQDRAECRSPGRWIDEAPAPAPVPQARVRVFYWTAWDGPQSQPTRCIETTSATREEARDAVSAVVARRQAGAALGTLCPKEGLAAVCRTVTNAGRTLIRYVYARAGSSALEAERRQCQEPVGGGRWVVSGRMGL